MSNPSTSRPQTRQGSTSSNSTPTPSLSSARQPSGSSFRRGLSNLKRSAEAQGPARRGQDEKRRREEAELRRMIQKEMQKANDAQLLLDEQESQIAAVERQAAAREEMAENQKRQMLNDVAKWERRLAQRMDAFSQRERELKEVEEQLRTLQQQHTQHKLTLSAKFLRQDMKPDFSVEPAEIFTRGASGSGFASKAAAEASGASSPLRRAVSSQMGQQSSPEQAGKGGLRRSTSMRQDPCGPLKESEAPPCK